MIFKDYYKILGLPNNKVTMAQIKTAYREQAKKYHPDVNIQNTRNEERFIRKGVSADWNVYGLRLCWPNRTKRELRYPPSFKFHAIWTSYFARFWDDVWI